MMKNHDLHSLRCDTKNKLSIGWKFVNDDIFYPWNLDFRGRAYPIPPNLNHLGSDMCRGMLTVKYSVDLIIPFFLRHYL